VNRFVVVTFFLFTLGLSAVTRAEVPNEPAVKYKSGKDLNFEQLVIEGQLQRPELSVVTGDSDENGNGLLRLRENFVDRMAEAAGQEAP
jgi:hypothetical protein